MSASKIKQQLSIGIRESQVKCMVLFAPSSARLVHVSFLKDTVSEPYIIRVPSQLSGAIPSFQVGSMHELPHFAYTHS